MKKLLSVFAAAAMLFGFASCSGDLHDDVVTTGGASDGYWYYINIDADVAEASNIIFNNSIGQSSDMALSKTSGNVFYTYDSVKKECAEITEAEAISKNWVNKNLSGLAVYVYSTATTEGLKAYAWNGDTKYLGEWSGTSMKCDTSFGTTEKYDITFNITIDLANTDYKDGEKIFLNGFVYGWNTWPFSEWGGSVEEANPKQFATISNGKATLSCVYTIESIGLPEKVNGAFCVAYPNDDMSNVDWQSADINIDSFKTVKTGMLGELANAGYAAKLEYPILISTDGTKDDKGKYKFTAVVQ